LENLDKLENIHKIHRENWEKLKIWKFLEKIIKSKIVIWKHEYESWLKSVKFENNQVNVDNLETNGVKLGNIRKSGKRRKF